jgi:hypothetical protein
MKKVEKHFHKIDLKAHPPSRSLSFEWTILQSISQQETFNIDLFWTQGPNKSHATVLRLHLQLLSYSSSQDHFTDHKSSGELFTSCRDVQLKVKPTSVISESVNKTYFSNFLQTFCLGWITPSTSEIIARPCVLVYSPKQTSTVQLLTHDRCKRDAPYIWTSPI